MNEDSLFHERIVKIYRNIKYKWACIVLVILTVSTIYDLFLCTRWPLLENIFSIEKNDFTGIAGMILVVWTFTMALVIFWMGRVEDKQYGIRIMDVFIKTISPNTPFKELTLMAIAIAVELIEVFFAVFFKWKYTLKITAFLQILTMMYIFMAVCIEGSRTNILEQIKKSSVDYILDSRNIGDGINDFMANMIKSIDYRDEREVNLLNNTIEKIVKRIPAWMNCEKKTNLQWYMQSFTDYVVKSCDNADTMEKIINHLFLKMDNVYAKNGIFFSIIDNEYQKGAPNIQHILGNEFNDRNIVIAAGLAYNVYISTRKNNKYRRELTRKLQCYIKYPLRKNETNEMIEVWAALAKQYGKNEENSLLNWEMNTFWELFLKEGEIR